MNTGKTLFARIMEFPPWTTFTRLVDRYGGDRYAKSLTCAEQFRIMAFAQLTYRESLRDTKSASRRSRPCRESMWRSGALRGFIAQRPLHRRVSHLLYYASGNFSGFARKLGAVRAQLVLLESCLPFRRVEIAAQQDVTVAGAELVLELSNEPLSSSV